MWEKFPTCNFLGLSKVTLSAESYLAMAKKKLKKDRTAAWVLFFSPSFHFIFWDLQAFFNIESYSNTAIKMLELELGSEIKSK
jgi:hypothetical protein